MSSVEDLGTILGVWAHPDDETYLSAGIMTAAVRNGQRVVCVTATRGEAGSQDEIRWPSSEMARIREAELRASLDALGVDEHHWLDYIDGTCDSIPGEEAVAKLRRIFDEVSPDTVLTFGPEGLTGHPDHQAVSAWTATAFDRYGKAGARLLFAIHEQEWFEEFGPDLVRNNVFAPGTPPLGSRAQLAIVHELDRDLYEVKLAALRAQVSQIELLHAALGPDFLDRALGLETFREAARHP